MKRLSLVLAATLVGCSSTAVTNRAAILAPNDLVLVDRLDGDQLAVVPGTLGDGTEVRRVGFHAGLMFVTSTDTSELRVFQPFREGINNSGDWARAPNPLETLSVPVLDQPMLLVADEGRTIDGRVTGAYVYASRPGATEVSIVSVRALKQLGGRPVPLPGALTSLAAWMDVTGPTLPATTSLYISTWDGARARVLRASLPTNEEQLVAQLETSALTFTEIAGFDGEAIRALQLVPSRAGRAVDGAPFCDTSLCVAMATRKSAGTGRSVLFDPTTGRSVALNFGAQVRDLALSLRADGDVRLFGVIDEEPCGGPACGGVLSVDLLSGTTASGFPRSLDVSGAPMAPIRSNGGLIQGLTVAPNAALRMGIETVVDGTVTFPVGEVAFSELGAFSASDGTINFFSGSLGQLLDFDSNRAHITGAERRLPGLTEDGGVSLTSPDGGAIGSVEALSVFTAATISGPVTKPWREQQIGPGLADGGVDDPWLLTIGDGYLVSQTLYAVTNGNLPGLYMLPAGTAGTRLDVTAGAEAVAEVGDLVVFYDNRDGALEPCGRARVVALQPAIVDIDAAPANCARTADSRFVVKADATRPAVISADVEGYLGRVGPRGEVIYRRPLVALPHNVGRVEDEAAQVWQPRDALRLVAPNSLPGGEGAYIAFTVEGELRPYRPSVDPFSVPCSASTQLFNVTPSQVVFGSVVMGFVPSYQSSSTAPLFRWTTFGVVPSGNGMMRIWNASLEPEAISTGAGRCYQ